MKGKSESINVGNRIKEFRSNVLGLTQKEFSNRLEITQANNSQIELGQCLPSAQFLLKLIESYPDINLNWLFFNEGKPYREPNRDQGEKKSIVPNKASLLNNFHEINQKMKEKMKELEALHNNLLEPKKVGKVKK